MSLTHQRTHLNAAEKEALRVDADFGKYDGFLSAYDTVCKGRACELNVDHVAYIYLEGRNLAREYVMCDG